MCVCVCVLRWYASDVLVSEVQPDLRLTDSYCSSRLRGKLTNGFKNHN